MKGKGQKCRLPEIGRGGVSHENFQKYLNEKASETKRNLSSVVEETHG